MNDVARNFSIFGYDDTETLNSQEYDTFDESRAADHQDDGKTGGNGNGNGGGHGRGHGGQGYGTEREITDLNGDANVTKQEFLESTDAWFARKIATETVLSRRLILVHAAKPFRKT